MGVEEGELLAPVDPVRGVVDVEHDPARHLGEAVAEQLDQRRHHPLERRRPGQVRQPAHGRLRAQVGAALRQPAEGQLERRVGAQGVAVVGVRVTRRDQQGAEADHLDQGRVPPLRGARVREAARQALGDPEPAVDLGQDQDAAVRGQPAAVEGDVKGLAGHR